MRRFRIRISERSRGHWIWYVLGLPLAAVAIFVGIKAIVEGGLDWGIGGKTHRFLPIRLEGLEARAMGLALILLGLAFAGPATVVFRRSPLAALRRVAASVPKATAVCYFTAFAFCVLSILLWSIRVEGAFLVKALLPVFLLGLFVWFLVWAFR